MHFPVKLLCNFFTPVLLIFFIKHYAVSLVTTLLQALNLLWGGGVLVRIVKKWKIRFLRIIVDLLLCYFYFLERGYKFLFFYPYS